MAFIREYMEASGDPFKFRVPRFIRKFQPGKALRRVAGIAAPFVPGLGGVLGKFQSALARRGISISPEQLQGFARSYGLDVGDPGKGKHRRKNAGAGPKAKAAHKRTARAERHGKLGQLASGLGSAAGAVGSQLLEHFSGVDLGAVQSAAAEAGLGGGLGAMHFGRRHRRQNPANVKALRHALSRVEGFQRLAMRVLPRVQHTMHRSPKMRRGRGHKAGCGCVVCRRRAA